MEIDYFSTIFNVRLVKWSLEGYRFHGPRERGEENKFGVGR